MYRIKDAVKHNTRNSRKNTARYTSRIGDSLRCGFAIFFSVVRHVLFPCDFMRINVSQDISKAFLLFRWKESSFRLTQGFPSKRVRDGISSTAR